MHKQTSLKCIFFNLSYIWNWVQVIENNKQIESYWDTNVDSITKNSRVPTFQKSPTYFHSKIENKRCYLLNKIYTRKKASSCIYSEKL